MLYSSTLPTNQDLDVLMLQMNPRYLSITLDKAGGRALPSRSVHVHVWSRTVEEELENQFCSTQWVCTTDSTDSVDDLFNVKERPIIMRVQHS